MVQSPWEGVRARARLVAETVDRLSLEINKPHILSIAAGHIREVELTGALRQKRIGRWVALDSDTESLDEVNRCYAKFGVETMAATVRQFLTGKHQMGPFDYVYSTGLFDYLQQPLAQRLVQRMFEMLRPGGQLLVANFLPKIRDIGYMESYMAWNLIYRSPMEMLDLAMTIDPTRIRDIRLQAEDKQHIMFLHITKK